MKLRWSKKILAGGVAVLSGLGLAVASMPVAHADPAGATAFQGVGSDTVESVLNSFAGAEPFPHFTGGVADPVTYYTPVHSDAASGQFTLSSWNALPQGQHTVSPSCITTKYGGPTFDRPNGSSAGINALNASLDATPWTGITGTGSCNGKIISNQVDFARSSRGPNDNSTTDLTFVPFGRDAVTYAILNKSATNLFNLTNAQLKAVYTSGSGTASINGVTVKACYLQVGSGTSKFFAPAIGTTEATAAAAANASTCGLLEEHDGNSFYAKANSVVGAGEAAIVPFSVAQWIAQANAAQIDRSATARTNGVDLGDADNLSGAGDHPYTGTAPNLAPVSAFYTFSSGTALGTFGRDVYTVWPTLKIDGGFDSDPAIMSLVVGNTSALCTAPATTRTPKFGFLTISNCGATTSKGNA